jgi:ATP/maltotriose-dependent transcriptional regulator MalT
MYAGIDHFERAATLYEETNNPRGLVSCLATLGEAAVELPPNLGPAEADITKPMAGAHRAVGIARSIGWRAGEAYALACLSLCLDATGAYREGLATAREALAIATDIDHGAWKALGRAVVAIIYWNFLAPQVARRHLELGREAALEAHSEYFAHELGLALAGLDTLAGDPAPALALADELSNIEPDSRIGLIALGLRADAEAARGNPVAAVELMERIGASPVRVGAYMLRQNWRSYARALAATGRARDAEAILLTARSNPAYREAPHVLWRVEAELGHLYRTLRRRAEADAAFASARQLIEQTAAALPLEPDAELADESLAAHFRRAAMAQLPHERAPTAMQAAKAASGGLTARERDVVALIAAGHSNREIAEALVLGERTVQTHIGNVFTKLGVSSRAAVAAWAAEHGLQAEPSH